MIVGRESLTVVLQKNQFLFKRQLTISTRSAVSIEHCNIIYNHRNREAIISLLIT